MCLPLPPAQVSALLELVAGGLQYRGPLEAPRLAASQAATSGRSPEPHGLYDEIWLEVSV